jgi:hypothetical protein
MSAVLIGLGWGGEWRRQQLGAAPLESRNPAAPQWHEARTPRKGKTSSSHPPRPRPGRTDEGAGWLIRRRPCSTLGRTPSIALQVAAGAARQHKEAARRQQTMAGNECVGWGGGGRRQRSTSGKRHSSAPPLVGKRGGGGADAAQWAHLAAWTRRSRTRRPQPARRTHARCRPRSPPTPSRPPRQPAQGWAAPRCTCRGGRPPPHRCPPPSCASPGRGRAQVRAGPSTAPPARPQTAEPPLHPHPNPAPATTPGKLTNSH